MLDLPWNSLKSPYQPIRSNVNKIELVQTTQNPLNAGYVRIQAFYPEALLQNKHYLRSQMAKPLPQFIKDQLNYLFINSPLQVKVDQIRSSSISSRYSDHFTVSVPFCLDYIKWDFMYNMTYPSLAPDIVFPIEDEEFNPLTEIVGEERNSCLRDWNSKDPSKLLALVNEIRDLYMDYQKKRAMNLDDDRLQFEANTILTREGVEVCVTPRVDGLDGAAAVRFVIPLLDNINLNKLVPGCLWKRQQKIYLEAAFPVSKGYPPTIPSPTTRLVASHSDVNSLFSVEELKLPQWANGMCMAEYLPILEDYLQIQVVEATASIGSRRRFIEALSPLFGRPVEADPVFCRKGTFFAISGNFMFLVHFAIPSQFPSQKPVLTLQNFQQSNHCSPKLSRPINDYPWSPRWNTSEMAQRIFDFMLDESLNFKRQCTEATP